MISIQRIIFLRGFFLGIFAKSNIQKQKYNQKKSTGYLGISTNINKIHLSNFLSILATTYKNTIPKTTSIVNVNIPLKDNAFAKLGVIKATPNQPAEILPNTDEKARSQGLVNKNFIVQ